MSFHRFAGMAALLLTACSEPNAGRHGYPAAEPPERNASPESVVLFPREMLADIRDDQVGVVQDAPYLFVLNAVARVDDVELSHHAHVQLGVPALVKHPDRFRGKLAKVKGRLVSIQPIEAPPNAVGLPYLYEGVVETSDWDYVIFHAFHKEGDFVPGKDKVEAEGVFLRLHPLPTPRGDVRAAPLILGKWLRRR